MTIIDASLVNGMLFIFLNYLSSYLESNFRFKKRILFFSIILSVFSIGHVFYYHELFASISAKELLFSNDQLLWFMTSFCLFLMTLIVLWQAFDVIKLSWMGKK
ncbi:MAG: hypothetical protein PHE89_01195 [Alphaproteobacteria bacterium]|nr:hypothetical protein [Alphaproteobacteria bacterium]